MATLTRRVTRAGLGVVAVVVAGAVVLGGELWWAGRGPKTPGPPPAPGDSPVGPAQPADGLATPVVWLGDSTGAGVGATGIATTLPEQVASQLNQPIRLTVLARSGARVADVVRLQLPLVARLQPGEVFITVGANDAVHLTTRSQFRRDYGRLMAGLPASVARVVLLGVPDLGSPPRLAQPLRLIAGWRGRQLASDIRHLASRRHAVYVDIAAGTGPAFRAQPKRYFASDRYHPNDAGYRLWATVTVAAVNRSQPEPASPSR